MAAPNLSIPRQHPSEEELIAHAAGQLDLSRRILLEGHLAYCETCRDAWSTFAAPGGHMLGETREEPTPPRLLDSLWVRIKSEQPASDPYANLPLPGELLAVLPRSGKLLDGPLNWGSPDNWTDGSRVACLLSDPHAEARLFLLEIPGGERIPRHQHIGQEHVLCLAGACSDEHTRLEAGDYYHYEPGTEHLPIMDSSESCWIAVRTEKGVRYTGEAGLAPTPAQRSM